MPKPPGNSKDSPTGFWGEIDWNYYYPDLLKYALYRLKRSVPGGVQDTRSVYGWTTTDIVQEAIANALSTCPPPALPRGRRELMWYICPYVNGVIANLVKSRGFTTTDPYLSSTDLEVAAPENTDDSEAGVFRRIYREEVLALLVAIDPLLGLVFEGRLQGLSLTEIAQAQRTSEKAIKSAMERIRTALRRIDRGDFDE